MCIISIWVNMSYPSFQGSNLPFSHGILVAQNETTEGSFCVVYYPNITTFPEEKTEAVSYSCEFVFKSYWFQYYHRTIQLLIWLHGMPAVIPILLCRRFQISMLLLLMEIVALLNKHNISRYIMNYECLSMYYNNLYINLGFGS